MNAVAYYYTADENIELIVSTGQARYYPWHMHTRHWTTGVIRSGAVCLTTATASRWCTQGQCFCIAPYEAHSLRVEPESSLVVSCCDAQGVSWLKHNPYALFKHIPCLPMEEIRGLVGCFTACIAPDFSNWHSKECLIGTHPLEGDSIREVMRLLLVNPADSFGIAQMAAHAGYSPWHFLRVFQKTTGMTPHAFQLLCRLRVARSLLRADTAASTAAVSAGFADQSHMHKVFKRHSGMTPGEFTKASVRLEL